MKTLYGHKIGMTQVFIDNGMAVPVTVIEVQPCYVTQIRTVPRDGYEAVQLGFDVTKRLNKPEAGHLAKATVGQETTLPLLRHLREVRGGAGDLAVGATVDVSLFSKGDLVDIAGIMKGRGFQGGVRRHGFHGGPKTHGQSDRHRAPGSIGSGTTPGRVFKGTRMAGHMGATRVTIQALEVIEVDTTHNLLLIKGAVPGPRTGLLEVKATVKLGKVKA